MGKGSGSWRPRLKHYLAKLKNKTGFGDPKVSARHPKRGSHPPVEQHWVRVCVSGSIHNLSINSQKVKSPTSIFEVHLVDHGHDRHGQVDLEAVGDGHTGATQKCEDQTPTTFFSTTSAA